MSENVPPFPFGNVVTRCLAFVAFVQPGRPSTFTPAIASPASFARTVTTVAPLFDVFFVLPCDSFR